MKIIYEAQIRDEDNGQVLVKVSSFSEEGLEEEMGKSKWTDVGKRYEKLIDEETEHELSEKEELRQRYGI